MKTGESKKWISKIKFQNLQPGTPIEVRYMKGSCEVAGPVIKGEDGAEDTIPVIFKDGAFAKKGKEFKLVRQQIARTL